MSASFLEIVQISEDEFVLRRANHSGEPLVRINFSKEAQAFMEDQTGSVVRSMINAAIQAVGQIHNATVQTVESEQSNRTIH